MRGLLLLALTGCIANTQDRTEVQLSATGQDRRAIQRGDVTINVERAELAFGPFYLCPGAQAGDLCDSARMEWTGSAPVDLLNPDEQGLGKMLGATGAVQSWMYDLGISSQLTREQPFVLPAAEALGGNSFVLDGRANRAGHSIRFSIAMPIRQEATTERGVPVIRKASSESFSHDITLADTQLVLRFDVGDVLARVTFASWFADRPCAPQQPIGCVDGREVHCDATGMTVEIRDCSAEQACVFGDGCRESVVLSESSEAYREVRNALVSVGRPSFEWRSME